VVFRSVAVAVVSILLNLLSVGAAYGVLTLVFQDGFLAPLLGFTPYGGVLDWLPMFLFVLLFRRLRNPARRDARPRRAAARGTGPDRQAPRHCSNP
jgi:RND superfamily putative drug exporter